MIDKGNSLVMNRAEALKLVLEVLKAQPDSAVCKLSTGKVAAKYIIDMADGFIDYLTGKYSQPEQ